MEEDYAKIQDLLFSGTTENIELAFALIKGQKINEDAVLAPFYEIENFLVGDLLMSPNYLEGTISKTFVYRLCNLEHVYLNISDDDRFDRSKDRDLVEIPASLYRLPNVKKLDFSYLGLIEIDEAIAQWTKLELINLSFNKIKKLPRNFSQFKSLSHLNLSANPLEEFPTEILNLTALIELNLEGTRLQNIPKEVTNLKNLELLNLSYNHFLTSIPDFIWELPKLSYIHLRECKILEELNIPQNTQSSVRLINCFACQLTQFPQHILQLPQLEKLNLMRNPIKEIKLMDFGEAVALYNLILPCVPQKIKGKANNLKKLTIHFPTELSEEEQEAQVQNLSVITQFKAIDELNLSNLREISYKHFPEFVFQLPNLQHLRIYGSDMDTIPQGKNGEQPLAYLDFLTFWDCPNLSEKYTKKQLQAWLPTTNIEIDAPKKSQEETISSKPVYKKGKDLEKNEEDLARLWGLTLGQLRLIIYVIITILVFVYFYYK